MLDCTAIPAELAQNCKDHRQQEAKEHEPGQVVPVHSDARALQLRRTSTRELEPQEIAQATGYAVVVPAAAAGTAAAADSISIIVGIGIGIGKQKQKWPEQQRQQTASASSSA